MMNRGLSHANVVTIFKTPEPSQYLHQIHSRGEVMFEVDSENNPIDLSDHEDVHNQHIPQMPLPT